MQLLHEGIDSLSDLLSHGEQVPTSLLLSLMVRVLDSYFMQALQSYRQLYQVQRCSESTLHLQIPLPQLQGNLA